MVQRLKYRMSDFGCEHVLSSDDNGGLVFYEDYAELEAKLAALEAVAQAARLYVGYEGSPGLINLAYSYDDLKQALAALDGGAE